MRTVSGHPVQLSGRQVLLREPHRHGALADRRRHSLDGVGAHVAGGEDAGQAGLERERQALERPRAAAGPAPDASGPVSR